MRIRDVTPYLLRGTETYGSGASGDEATDQGDWLLLIRVRTEDGLAAWADVETLAPVAARVVRGDGMGAMGFKTLEELLVGREIEDLADLDRIWDELFIGSVYYGRRGVALQALSAIDNCLWALVAQRDGRDLADLLGGRRHDRIPAYASTLFRGTPEGNAAAARSYRDRGFRGVKFGWGGFGIDAGRDAESLAAIMDVLGDDLALMVDPGWYVTDHDRPRLRTEAELRSMLELLDRVRPTWVEDIVHPEQFEQYAELRADFPDLPFAAGEQQATRWELERLIATGGLRYLQPDLSRCGGLTVARRLVRPADDHGVQIVTHSWLTDLLHSYSLHLLATLPAAPWVEFNVAQSALSRGVVSTPMTLNADGTVDVPTSALPELDESFIQRMGLVP